jgi:N-acylglucosamine-6-phosphate 2-epimerase/N-acetylmuramic acid 6-phosphate etherase
VRLPFAIPALIVSAQARADNPLHGAGFMAAMARAAEQGGAAAIRANGPDDIRAIRAASALPVIGINKIESADSAVYITPSFAAARAVAEAGATMIAIDATARPRQGEPAPLLISLIHSRLKLPVMADVATLEEGVEAVARGADCVATTLAGYTDGSSRTQGPDLGLVHDLVRRVSAPVIAEGRFWTPAEVTQAFALGAAAVVVGTAITNPREITRRFVAAVPR